MPRTFVHLLAIACLLLAAPAARANWYPSETVDGPADIVALGGADVGRDGDGAVVYLRRDAGVAHVYVARLIGGALQAPERVDVGIDAEATDAAVAAGDDQRLAIVWLTAGGVYGSFAPGGPVGPLSPPQLLYGSGGPPSGVDVDMGVNGTAYASFVAPGAGGADVRAVRLAGSTWEMVPQPLDIDPADAAGTGAGRPRIAVAADGNAVATWGERGSVFARRLTGLNLSVAPQGVSLPDLDGAPGGVADSPAIDIEDDGSFAWVVLRQDFGGVSQTLARRLVGSQFEAPAVIGTPGAVAPSIAMDERGVGQAVAVAPGGTILAAPLEHDAFGAPVALAGGGDGPLVATSERLEVATVWRFNGAQVAGVFRDRHKRLGRQTLLSTLAFGAVPAGTVRIGADRLGDVAVAMLQGDPGARRVAVAVYDRPPSAPLVSSSTLYQRRRRPLVRFSPGLELWGTPTFDVMIDGVLAGTTQSSPYQVARPIAQGKHRLRVVEVDRRGQTGVSRERVIRVDGTAPRIAVHVRGRRRRGATLRISVRARDGRGSGVKYVRIGFGDGSRRVLGSRASHRYRAGTFTLTVKAGDKVGNVGRRTVKLRIKP